MTMQLEMNLQDDAALDSPAEAIYTPAIRFKGFSGDWAISQLSDFISIKHGFAFDGKYFSEMESNL